MKTLKSIYWLALAAALALAACSKEDPAPTPEPNPEPEPEQTEIVIEKTEYTLDADEERTATVAFTAAADWTLSVVYDDAESSANWLSVTPMSGTAGQFPGIGPHGLCRSGLRETERAADRHPDGGIRRYGFHRPIRPGLCKGAAKTGYYRRCGKYHAGGYGKDCRNHLSGRFRD